MFALALTLALIFVHWGFEISNQFLSDLRLIDEQMRLSNLNLQQYDSFGESCHYR
jgi:hypothetical protein